MLGHRQLNYEDYIAILRRRLWVIVIPTVLAPLIAYGISLRMKDRYMSTTLVLVEQQKVPDSYVRPVITEELQNRLATMQDRKSTRLNSSHIQKSRMPSSA